VARREDPDRRWLEEDRVRIGRSEARKSRRAEKRENVFTLDPIK
jgi:hypothetical protein